jgi:lauroyl/myristoyl acyltransferase
VQDRRPFIHAAPEWLRFLAERCLVVPAAAYLPRSWAFAVADAVGWAEARLPIEGTRVARREMRAAATPESELQAAVSEHLSWIRHNLVYAVRFRRGREHTRDWTIREANGGPVHALRKAGKPILVVSAHFVDVAGNAVNTVLFPELAGRAVSQVTPDFAWSPFVLRTRLYNGLQYGLSRLLVDPSMEAQIPKVGTRGVFAGAVAQLTGEAKIAKLLADAFWEKEGAYRRPFAAMPVRGFALGVPRIARAAQCHVVTYAATFEDSSTVRVEWGEPHPPPSADDEASDRAFIDMIIDELERYVGQHPTQYIHPMGSTRRWDPATERWT